MLVMFDSQKQTHYREETVRTLIRTGVLLYHYNLLHSCCYSLPLLNKTNPLNEHKTLKTGQSRLNYYNSIKRKRSASHLDTFIKFHKLLCCRINGFRPLQCLYDVTHSKVKWFSCYWFSSVTDGLSRLLSNTFCFRCFLRFILDRSLSNTSPERRADTRSSNSPPSSPSFALALFASLSFFSWRRRERS